jgi:hypothetical protein
MDFYAFVGQVAIQSWYMALKCWRTFSKHSGVTVAQTALGLEKRSTG